MTRIFKDARRWLPGVLISLVFIAVLVQTVDWDSVLFAFAAVDWRFVVLHGLFYFASLSSRAMGSRTLLEDRPTFGQSFLAMMEGYLLNNVLPLRLGELGRAFVLGRYTGLGTFHALPAIMIERAYDLAYAALILMGTLPFVLQDVAWARPVALTTLGLVAIGLLSLHLIARFRTSLRTRLDRVAGRVSFIQRTILPRIDSFLDGLAVLTSPRRFTLSLLWMALAWAFGIANQFALLRGFLKDAPLLYSTFSLGVSSFGGAIPSAPASLGVFEGAVVAALTLLGVSSGVALAFAVTHHVLHIIYSGVIGMLGFSHEGIGLMDMYDRLLGRKENRESDRANSEP
jgi:uncharacterized protein (TIRG00374 family)